MTWTELAAEARRHDASMTRVEWFARYGGEPGFITAAGGVLVAEFPRESESNRPDSVGSAFARNNLSRFAEACERVEELEKALRAVEKYSQLGIDNDEAVKCDATDHIRVREIAREALGAVK